MNPHTFSNNAALNERKYLTSYGLKFDLETLEYRV
jgi:hypothetical protein